MKKTIRIFCLGLGMLTLSSVTATAFSAEVKDLLKEGGKRTTTSAKRQTTVNGIVTETDKMFREYVRLLKENDTLRTYISLKEREIKRQQESIAKIKNDINQISRVVRKTAPLMHKMTDALGDFVSLDVPFLLDERVGRLNTLKSILDRPDVSEAEKFRKVLEAYQIELEFGNTIETYQETFQPTPDSPEETVNFLRVGRIALVAQSLDSSRSYMWDINNRVWKPISAAVYSKALKEGVNIASKRSAPDLLSVPVALTVSAGK